MGGYVALYFQLSNLKLFNPANASLYSIVHREENDANKRFLMSSCRRSTYVSTHSDLKLRIPFENDLKGSVHIFEKATIS